MLMHCLNVLVSDVRVNVLLWKLYIKDGISLVWSLQKSIVHLIEYYVNKMQSESMNLSKNEPMDIIYLYF